LVGLELSVKILHVNAVEYKCKGKETTSPTFSGKLLGPMLQWNRSKIIAKTEAKP